MKSYIQAYIFNDNEDLIIKRATLWNMMASLLNAVTTALLLFFVSRFCGVEQAGMFSIASAMAYQCVSLGNFGTRNFHAADIKYEYKFKDYVYQRIIAVILLYGLLCYYAFMSGYSVQKSLIVLTFGIYKSVDVIEDLFHGEYHRQNRLDIGALLLFIRYVITLSTFIIAIIVTGDFILSCTLAPVLAFIIFIVENKNIIKIFYKGDFHFDKSKVISLIIILIPIVISNSIKLYISNSPKYAIDAVLGDFEQAYFNVLFMPVFVINLMSEVIFRPYIPKISSEWNRENYSDFLKMVIKQIIIIAVLTIIVLIGGYVIGLKLLEIIYGMKLMSRMPTFLLLLVGGGVTSLCNYLMLILTIERQQNKMAIVNIVTFIICLLISNPLVQSLGITGASLLFIVLNCMLALGYFVIGSIAYVKKVKEGKVLNNE